MPIVTALRAVLEARLGRLDDADFTAETLQAAEDTMRDLGYRRIERGERTHLETISVDFVIGHILSATSTDQIPAAERQDFAREVRSAISAVEPSGCVVETVSVRAVIGRTAQTCDATGLPAAPVFGNVPPRSVTWRIWSAPLGTVNRSQTG